MRNVLITTLAMTATVGVIGNAYMQKKQFYPSVVYITKSNSSMAVIYIQALIMIWLFGKLMQKIFFGELRAAEIEHLIEKFWYAITETCLAFTVFKDDFSPKFIALFALLLFLKTFHWLAEDRVDYMERSPVISWLFHARINLLLCLLGIIDLYFIQFAYHHTITKGASVQLVFGFEYAILLTMVVNTAIKYVLHMIDINREVFWENKAVFLLYVEVFIGLVKVALYVMFVILMMKLYTLPLFAFRPMYYSMRNFKKALNDVIHSRRAIRNMNTLYPDATIEELAAVDNVCIICREEMQAGAKKLPCNHIFHVSCLRSWFQRHQTCPTCRLNVLRVIPENQTNVHAPPMPQAAAGQPPNVGIPPLQFAAWPQFVHPPPTGGQGPPTSEQQAQASTSNAQSSSGGASSATNNFPVEADAFFRQFPFLFMMPPMPPFVPGVIPPPMPPPNWSGMSVEELRNMEANTREAIEARLLCLRNIHNMIECTSILMQQYLASTAAAAAAIVSASTSNVTSGSQNTSVAPGSSDEHRTQSAVNNPGSSASQETVTSDKQVTDASGELSPSQPLSTEAPSSSLKSSEQLMKEVKISEHQSDQSSDVPSIETTDDVEEQERIRRRRVEKFANMSP